MTANNTPETRSAMYWRLGQAMVDAVGLEACISDYGTSEIDLIGESALSMGDINRDGTLN